jgi:Protein of unknown function (DUF1552)
MNFKINRRGLLTSAGGFAALPLLEMLSSKRALADASSDPRRLVMIHFPNGTVTRQNNPTWFSAPDGPVTPSNAPIPFQPFSGNLGDFTILKFLTQSARQATYNLGGGGHQGSKPCFFTGQVPSNLGTNASGLSGDSFDVMYAKLTPQKKSFYLANAEQYTDGLDGVRFNYELSRLNGQNVVPEINPVRLFQSNFSMLMGGVPPLKSDYQRNPKILEVPTAAAQTLRAQLGKDDRLRLDAYLSGLGDLKTKLGSQPPPTTSCQAPPSPTVDLATTNQRSLSGKSYFDRMLAFNSLIAVAFQCDLIRSVAISFGDESNFVTYNGAYPSGLNYNGASVALQADHSLSHNTPIGGSNSGGFGFNENMTRDRLHLFLVVDLVNKLKAITDPSGSKVLDNTIVMGGFCVDDGQHDGASSLGSPVVVAGGKNFMSPGRSLNATNFDLNDLYFTFASKLGMNLSSFYPIDQITVNGNRTGRKAGTTLIPL